jgi:hypothetical protein
VAFLCGEAMSSVAPNALSHAGNIEYGMANHDIEKVPDGSRGRASRPGLGVGGGVSTPRKAIDNAGPISIVRPQA